jgi:hypothetical protein
MPLSQQQVSDLWNEIQSGLAKLPFGLGRGMALNKADEAARTIPVSLREARVGDVADQYIAWRRGGRI